VSSWPQDKRLTGAKELEAGAVAAAKPTVGLGATQSGSQREAKRRVGASCKCLERQRDFSLRLTALETWCYFQG